MTALREENLMSSPKFEVKVLEEGILENTVREGAHIEAEDIRRIKQLNLELAGEKKYCVLITSMFLSSISKEARELSASKEFVQNTIAKALLVNSMGHQIVGNFYLTVNKPHIKTKIFHDREKALTWLRGQLAK